ncbi:3-deoxy-D-manno-octulosonic acid transferase [Desulfurella sp.]|uniref:3-deoxy-D-manno-octulosonic acid transferase n=1 Tax=Desulfurella sp. TaxID=1962857 RepID=UPI003D0F0832
MSLPYLLVKAVSSKRFRYKFFDRINPKPIKQNDYILIHLASLGEAKAFLNIKETVESIFKKKLLFSVTSNIGYDYLKSQGLEVFLAPLDFNFLYKRLFKQNLPHLAIFFETEIWPSYINYLKKHNTRVILINARMSDKSYKFYLRFKVFYETISKFDVIIAKSQKDKEKFDKFNNNVKLCDNIKYALRKKVFDNDFLHFIKMDNKKIFVFASLHKQELEFLQKAINEVLSLGYRVIIAPRYMEDLPLFEKFLKGIAVEYSMLSKLSDIKDCVLVDRFGILEALYSISSMVFVGGSLSAKLKGHNPIEPAVYNNFVFCGRFMDSFAQEVEFLKRSGCLVQIHNFDNLKSYILEYEKSNFCNLERKTQEIITCYKNILSKLIQV